MTWTSFFRCKELLNNYLHAVARGVLTVRNAAAGLEVKAKKRVRSCKFWNKNWILFHVLHFRCLHLGHTYHKQKCRSGTTKYTSSEQRNVECFYTYQTFVFICRIHIVYRIVTYKQYHQLKIFFLSNKVHFYYSLCQPRKEKDILKHVL